MQSGEEIRRGFVEGWILRAEDDLAVARLLLQEGERFAFAVAFHSQQAVEKFLKAMLVEDQTDFPKTHDITGPLQHAGCAPVRRHACSRSRRRLREP